MWFIGLILGAALGAAITPLAMFAGGVIGTLIGLYLGQVRKEGAKTSTRRGAADEQRLLTLEAQVAWLHRETQRLRGEIAGLKGEAPAPAPAAKAAALEAQGFAVPPGVFVDETPTQPGYEPEGATVPPLSPAAVSDAGLEDGGTTAASPSGPAIPRSEPAAWQTPGAVAEAEPTWWQRLLSGNLLAKIGVVLLFFAVASALRLAADYGFLPVQLRLLVGAVGGLAMVAFGWTRCRPEADGGKPAHWAFGIALQGGGFALLYLIVYFMLARYGLVGPVPAFTGFVVLGVACILLAAAQDGVVLAVFGLAGAFAAPVLASTGSGDPLPLFSYFTLLNLFIVAVSWFKNWRALNVTGFFCTIGVGMAWAVEHYQAQYFGVTQGFLLFFWALYSATPVLMALFRAPGWAGWSDGTLVFGTPLVAFALQSQLAGDRYELAWAALGAALWYGALWALLFRRREPASLVLERCQLGLAIAFATLAVPLAFGAQVTSAFWALEGVAVVWFGVAHGRRLAMATGTLLQLAAGAYFLAGIPEMDGRLAQALPVFNDLCLGGVLLAGAGYASARLLRGYREDASWPLLVWALLWWLGSGLHEIDRLTLDNLGHPLSLLFTALSLAALELSGRRDSWGAPRHLALLLLPALWLAAGDTWSHYQHCLAGLMVLALPAAVAIHAWMLARQEADGQALLPGLRHLGVFWLGIGLVSVELAWIGDRLAPGVSLWSVLAVACGPLLGLAVARYGVARSIGAFARQGELYLGIGSLLPALVLGGWVVISNFQEAGDGSGLPYLPVLNPFDLVQLAAMLALYRWLSALAEDPLPGLPSPPSSWVGGLAFVWISCLAARLTHHWGGVPFTGHALWASMQFQTSLTLLWTLLAIAAMIRAARVGQRLLWQGGFALLGVVGAKLMLVDLANAGTLMWTGSLMGVALLVLAASYFAPVPPADED